MNDLLSPSEELQPACVLHSAHLNQGAVVPNGISPIPSPKGIRRGALLWGIGSTILSAIGLVAFALFEQYNGMLTELRNDLKHFNETSSEYVKRDRFVRVIDQLKEQSKELQASCFARAQLEQELRANERAREETVRELQRMRERLAFVEGRQTLSADLPSVPGQETREWPDRVPGKNKGRQPAKAP
jgi:hypothetical protein